MASKNHAIVIKGPGDARIEEVSIPKLRDEYMIVKVKAVAVNPTDWKHIDIHATPGARVGCDYAGIVEEVGSKVTKPWRKGQRVTGFCHGSNAFYHEGGVFGEYISAKGDVQIEIPESLSFEEAATLGAGISTIGLALYQSLKLPMPDRKPVETTSILIYGGSTATGALAIQYAKLSGLKIFTTCAPRNFEYVKSLGADFAYDYKDKNVVQEIKKQSKGEIHHVLDCVAEGESTSICVGAMSNDGGIYDALRLVDNQKVTAINDKVELKMTVGYTIFGEAFRIGQRQFAAKPEDFEFAKIFWEISKDLLAKGKVKPHKHSVNEGGEGLEGVLKGIQSLRERKVSGRKLVYTL